MEESKKFYSQRAITIATYFGGPLAAGYLVKKNYETLEQPENAKKSFLIGIISTILIFVGIFSIPEEIIDKIPNALIPLIYTGIIYLIVEKIQGESLKIHKESGGEFYSGWKAAGVGAISLVIIAAMAFIAGDLYKSPADFDNADYENNISELIKNEEKALELFTLIENAEVQEAMQFIVDTGIPYWQKNIQILDKLNDIEELPENLKNQNQLLREYCDLRIETYQLIGTSLLGNKFVYMNEIEEKNKRIEEVLLELEE